MFTLQTCQLRTDSFLSLWNYLHWHIEFFVVVVVKGVPHVFIFCIFSLYCLITGENIFYSRHQRLPFQQEKQRHQALSANKSVSSSVRSMQGCPHASWLSPYSKSWKFCPSGYSSYASNPQRGSFFFAPQCWKKAWIDPNLAHTFKE